MIKIIFLLICVCFVLFHFYPVKNVSAREENYSFSGVDRLIVEGKFLSVVVAEHPEKTVDAQIIIPERIFRNGIRIKHQQADSELRFWVERKILFDINLLFDKSAKMLFKVPEGCWVKIINSSGEVRVDNIMSHEVWIQTTSGKIDTGSISADLHLSSTSGKIRVTGCNGKKQLKATSGQISIQDSAGDLKVDTTSGRQVYEGTRGGIIAHSSSGSLNIRDHEGSLSLESTSGKQTGREISVTGDSSFQTSSGKIDIDFINNMDDFTFNLSSSSGKIELGETRARRRIVTGNGKILLKARSSSGRQTYRRVSLK